MESVRILPIMEKCLHVDALKERIINDFNQIFKQLQKGYKPSLTDIMDKLVFLELKTRIDKYKVIYQKLNNNGL